MAHDEQGRLVIDEAVASGTVTHVAPEVFMGEFLTRSGSSWRSFLDQASMWSMAGP